jgi:hypothetical protein
MGRSPLSDIGPDLGLDPASIPASRRFGGGPAAGAGSLSGDDMTRSRSYRPRATQLPRAVAWLPGTATRMSQALARRLGLERNALRRGTDRFESAVAVASLLVFVVSAPLLVLMLTPVVYDAGIRAEHTGGHQVTARLTTPAPKPEMAPFDDPGPPPRTQATAAWSYAGTSHTGQVRVPEGTPAGTRVAVWVDSSGNLTEPPQSHTWTLGLTALAGAGAVAGPAIGLWAVRRLVRRGLIQWQLAAWEAEWAAVESEWSRRG